MNEFEFELNAAFTEREFDEVCEYLVSVGLGYLVADMRDTLANASSIGENLDAITGTSANA